MPRYALANDNWIGRMPFPFTPRGELLGQMTLKTLARGLMCVNKIIAEPERLGPRNSKQGGLRGNTIIFPQAKLELLDSNELPAPPDKANEFMSKSVSIALTDVDKNDLGKAKWAEIPRQDYIDAARICTAHSSMAYEGVDVNEERAQELFAVRGGTSDAVERQAAPVPVEGLLPYRCEGPADTGCAGAAGGSGRE